MLSADAVRGFELAYQSALRLLDQQHSNLNDLRARAVSLLTAGSLVVAVLGTSTHSLDGWGWAGLAVFSALVLAGGALLWPSTKWVFGPSPTDLIAEYLEPRDGRNAASCTEVFRDQALHLHRSWQENGERLRWRYVMLRVMVVLLGGELVFLFLNARRG